MERREFLKLMSLSAASLAFPSLALSRTKADADKFFVLIRMTGGWDVTLSLDPKTHTAESDQSDMFIEYAPSEILKSGNLSLGPAMAPMMRHSGGFSVANGIITATTDNGHGANLDYMSSGNGEGKAPFVPVEIGVASRSGSLGMVFSGDSKSLDREMMLTTTANVEALKNSLRLGNFKDFIEMSGQQDSFYAAQKALLNDSARLDGLNLLMAKSAVESESDSTKRAAKILAAAFASGTSFQGQIDVISNLDTHSAHEGEHLRIQTEAWEKVASIFDIFKSMQSGTSGQSLFDRTVFMVISEFSRTPALNAGKGKDHNPLTNSTLFAGGGIVSGQSFGSSHLITRKRSRNGEPSHTALPVDFATGTVATTRAQAEAGTFKYMTPEVLIATVAQSMNVDWTKFRSVSQNTPFIKSLLKPGF